MARNSEKAQSMLYRFRAQQAREMGMISVSDPRPRDIESVTDIQTCERWRSQVVKDISRKMNRIHDPTLSDYQIRDVNDAINRLMKEKEQWEVQLRNLGGPNYLRSSTKIFDTEGKEVPGNKGYKYYGRARDLPGVKELFETDLPSQADRQTQKELWRKINADYYGYRDEEDGKLIEYECEQEKIAWENTAGKSSSEMETSFVGLPAHIKLPSSEEVMQHLLETRRKALLAKYSSR